MTGAEISPWMPKATVAIEDRRFYQRGGIDPVGIVRAFVADVSAGHLVQGGSTITQELVRSLYLSQDKTLQRKVVEACLSIKLAHAWSRDRILTAYLNDVYYGNHAYGIEAAAETYFSTPASRLTVEQSALLAGLPQAPSYYDPLHDPFAALARRDDVLRALRRSGDITEARYTAAVRDRSLHLRPSPAYGSREPYFVGYVEDILEQEYGAATLRTGGLKIYTAIRPRLQRAAVEALSHVVYAPRSRRRDRLHRPGDRSHPGDGRRDARSSRQPVQPCDDGRAPGGLDVQAHRPRRRGRLQLAQPVAIGYVVAWPHGLRYALSMAGLLTLEDAQERMLERAHPLSVEPVPVARGGGRVTAEDVLGRVDLPPFASSAMDGFAVCAADLPATLRVVGESAAGRPYGASLEPGCAVAISTGAVVPQGADSVIPVEHVVKTANSVEIRQTVKLGAHVRPRAGDAAAGEVVVRAGTRLTPALLAAAAASGVAEVPCTRRPRVVVLATGSELVAAGEELEPGQIYETNTLMLAAALEAAGAEVTAEPPAPDDEASLRAALERALAVDVLVTSGGVSVGEHDLVREVARELGVKEIFWRVSIKPGKPVSFGMRGETLVFGLPGNPVSALVGSELFVKPALRALQGLAAPLPRFEPGRLGAALSRNEERDEFVRARSRVDRDVLVLEPLVGQESHMIVRSGAADALVHVPRGNGELAAGSTVRWLRLGSA